MDVGASVISYPDTSSPLPYGACVIKPQRRKTVLSFVAQRVGVAEVDAQHRRLRLGQKCVSAHSPPRRF